MPSFKKSLIVEQFQRNYLNKSGACILNKSQVILNVLKYKLVYENATYPVRRGFFSAFVALTKSRALLSVAQLVCHHKQTNFIQLMAMRTTL